MAGVVAANAVGQGVSKLPQLLEDLYDQVFDDAPVMMHAVDRRFDLVRVNRKWLARLGYQGKEVLGDSCTDFLSRESRERAAQQVVPQLQQAGRARGEWFRWVRRDGNELDLLLDAEMVSSPMGNYYAYAALHDPGNPAQQEQADTTIRVLRSLIQLRQALESPATSEGLVRPDPALVELQRLGRTPQTTAVPEGLTAFLETARDISAVLRSVSKAQEEWLEAQAEQQQEMVLVAKSIDKSLGDLVAAVETSHQVRD